MGKVRPFRKQVPDKIFAPAAPRLSRGRGRIGSDNVTNSGAPYNNSYCFVFRLSGGRLAEVTEYMDTELVTAALGAPA